MPTPNIKNKRHVAHLEQVRRQNQAVKIGSIIVIVVVLAVVAYGIFIDPIVKQSRPVASVNGETISVGRFQAQAKFQRMQLVGQYNQYLQYAQMFGITDLANDQNFGPAVQQIQSQLLPETLGKGALDASIEDVLIRQEAKRRNITVSAQEVEKELQEGVGYFPNGSPTPTLTDVPLIEPTLNATQLALVTITPTPGGPTVTNTATITNTSIPTSTATTTVDPLITPSATSTVDPRITPSATITATVTATTTATATATETATATVTAGPSPTPLATATPLPTSTPVTADGYKELFKQQLENLNKEAHLSEGDFRTYYESVLYRKKVEDIVMADLKPSQEQVWARHILVATEDDAKKILDRLKKGEDFAEIAKTASTDTGSGAKGGDLGWFGKEAMVKEFGDAAFALKVGEISQPVKSSFGYHIIQVLGHEDRQLDAEAFKKFKDQKFADFLKKLRDDSTVTEFDLWKEVVPTEPALPAAQAQ